ncbi:MULTISPECIES: zinc-binding dehydrogenase [unclassified Streptomyces]|uniref:zinc-binding dehydrogenase n=1 Tax=unclassified Streptomyces TaxID=2593676 RepID=UPI003317A6F4
MAKPIWSEICTTPGDHVLLTAAAGGVGLAAIQTARRIGAVAVATTRSPDKKQAPLDAGAAHVIVTDEEDLPTRVKEITSGEGVRLAFDPIAGPGVDTLAEAIAAGGKLLVYGALDPRPTPLPNAALYPDLSTSMFTMFRVTAAPERLRRAVAFVNAGLSDGSLAPVVDRTFDLDDVAEAHRYMESNAQTGKIVMTVSHAPDASRLRSCLPCSDGEKPRLVGACGQNACVFVRRGLGGHAARRVSERVRSLHDLHRLAVEELADAEFGQLAAES